MLYIGYKQAKISSKYRKPSDVDLIIISISIKNKNRILDI